MLKTHEKFRLIDKSKKNDFFAEVNWNLTDQKTNDCKVVRFTFPDGKEAFVERKHLLELVFAIGRPEDQVRLIPQTEETVHWRKTVLGVKATKDIRKGEMLNFPIEISFPCPYAKREFIGKIEKPGKLVLPGK